MRSVEPDEDVIGRRMLRIPGWPSELREIKGGWGLWEFGNTLFDPSGIFKLRAFSIDWCNLGWCSCLLSRSSGAVMDLELGIHLWEGLDRMIKRLE